MSEYQAHRIVSKMQTDRTDDDLAVVAEINIRLRRSGAMSIEGDVVDLTLALGMIDNARDAIVRNHVPADALVIPSKDVGFA